MKQVYTFPESFVRRETEKQKKGGEDKWNYKKLNLT